MNIALIGSGKTGSKVRELLEKEGIKHTVFNSKHQPTKENLKDFDVIICFLTGEIFSQYVDLLMKSNIPVISGATGFVYSDDLNQKLIAAKTPWIVATNFSLGMNLIFNMIKALKNSLLILPDYEISIHEIHHTQKLDAPSGTALSWKKWLGLENTKVTSERKGDEIGFHEITLRTSTEEIKLSHQALDRQIFAQGALYSAQHVKSLKPGLHHFEDFIKEKIKEGLK